MSVCSLKTSQYLIKDKHVGPKQSDRKPTGFHVSDKVMFLAANGLGTLQIMNIKVAIQSRVLSAHFDAI